MEDKMKRWFCAVCAGMMLSGCVAPPEQQASAQQEVQAQPANHRVYAVMLQSYGEGMGGLQWLMDAQGNTVTDDERFTVLYDIITGEPQCKVRTRAVPTGERYEYGGPITNDMSALYDMEGNLLHDWAQGVYEPGFGEYVLRYEDDYRDIFGDGTEANTELCSLWNYVTGETVVQGVAGIDVLDNGRILLNNVIGQPLGVIEQDGSIYSWVPAEDEWYSAYGWQEYIVANRYDWNTLPAEQNNSYVLMNDRFEVLVERELLLMYPHALCCYGDGETSILTPEGEEKVVFPADDLSISIQMADDELLVMCDIGGGQGGTNYRLMDFDGNILAGGFHELYEVNDGRESKTRTELFLGMREDSIELVDRTGAVVASRDVPGVNYIWVQGEGTYTYSAEVDGQSVEGVLNDNLEMIIPEKEEQHIYRPYDYNEQHEYMPLDVLCVSRDGTDALYDLDGNVLVDGLSDIYDVGPNRIACRKGFEAGLMDWEGSWIVKRSIFDTLIND